MKYTVAAGILIQALPVLSGGIYHDAVLSGIDTCDPLSNDAHIGRGSCESGFECIADEASELGGSCVSLSVIRAIAASAMRDLQETNLTNVTFFNETRNSTDVPEEPLAEPEVPEEEDSSASMLSASVVVSMIGVVAALALN